MLKHTLYNYLSSELKSLDAGRAAGDERWPLPSDPPGLPRTGGVSEDREGREGVLKGPIPSIEATTPIVSSSSVSSAAGPRS